jgi:hypothetical protein
MNKAREVVGSSRLIPDLFFVILALLLTGLQVYHAANQPYTPFEDWAVSWSSAQVSDAIQLNQIFTVDYFPLDIWTVFFGTATPVTRYLSTIFNVLGLAFLFRFCADLFNIKIAFTAIVLLGTLAIVQNLIWQALPYAAVCCPAHDYACYAIIIITLDAVPKPQKCRALFWDRDHFCLCVYV